MEFGGEAHFGIDDSVGTQVLGTFACDPFDAVGGLHDRNGVGERFEVEGEVFAVGPLHHPFNEGFGFGGRQVAVAQFVGEFDDRLRPESTVEMIVKQDLRRTLDAL